jgi:uncharacterized membrane protein
MVAAKGANTPAAESIDAILRLEKEEQGALAPHHRIFHAIGSFVGTVQFIVFQCVAVALWIFVGHHAPSLALDEYPYPLLATILALEAVLLTSCVLIRQNAADRILEKRDHLELQINLLAEREATRSLRILQRVAKRLDVADEDCEPDELARETSAKEIANEIRAREQAEEERIKT